MVDGDLTRTRNGARAIRIGVVQPWNQTRPHTSCNVSSISSWRASTRSTAVGPLASMASFISFTFSSVSLALT